MKAISGKFGVVKRSASVVAWVFILVGGLVACGSKGSGTADQKRSSSPLAEVLGYGGSPAEQQAQAEAQQRVAQEKIAACMRSEGFKYVPFSNLIVNSVSSGPPEGGEVAWKRKNGYGVADSLNSSFAPQPNQAKDPNEAIQAALSPADRTAYQKALYGSAPDSTGPTPDSFTPTGCISQAFGGEELQAAYKPLSSKFEELQRRTTSDARSVKITSAWSGCMKKAGYSMKNQQEYYEVLSPEQNKIFAPQPGETAETIVAADESGSGSPRVAGPDPAKIAEFRKVELKLATADADCMSQDKVNELRDITREYERAFVDENRVLLEKIKALSSP